MGSIDKAKPSVWVGRKVTGLLGEISAFGFGKVMFIIIPGQSMVELAFT